MADWMDSFLNEDDGKKRDDTLFQFAVACKPVMTKRLVDQLEKDVRKYAAAKSDPIRISIHNQGASIFREGTHPIIHLRLFMDAKNPLIHCEGLTRETSDSEDRTILYDIHIVAERKNNCFYRINGEKLNEVQISEEILRPLLILLRA
jgi:hypothetical protein